MAESDRSTAWQMAQDKVAREIEDGVSKLLRPDGMAGPLPIAGQVTRSLTIEIKDVRTDGFPTIDDEDRILFWTHHGLIKGDPLLHEPGERPSCSESITTEQAMHTADTVYWESAFGLGLFVGVVFWVPAAALEKAFKP